MRILAVESSCDDTAAAVLADGAVLSSIVASQDDVHNKFGGVVELMCARSDSCSLGGGAACVAPGGARAAIC